MTTPVGRLNTALLGHYEIEREIGQGGMATVYLAHDVRHDRRVALKVLRPELSAILGAERFLKEIRTTANLQHPHILPLHDSGEADGMVFYVMPYVEGESLRHRLIREKQLPVDEAVRIACEVAGALDYAHRHGVVHRDIKPENILLHDGRAQVADFGIALAVSSAGGGTRITETGMSLGTPHYMSPEQAMGEREITPRSDVYALGCVLYEMLLGEPPFTGPTAQAIIARVVTEEPRSLVLQRRTIQPHVEAVVLKALEKLPPDRFATAGQFAAALEKPGLIPETRSTSARAALPPDRSRWRTAIPWGVAVIAAGAGLWIGGMRRSDATAPAPVVRFDLAFGTEASPIDAAGSPIALSPDGSRIVYLGRDAERKIQLFSRLLDQTEPVPMPGTLDALQPFFSPDGRWVGFFQDGKLRKISVAGGAVVTICDLPSMQGASWAPGDLIVFSSRGRLHRVAAAGGAPELLAAPDSATAAPGAFRWPEVLPDGRTVLFTHVGTGNTPALAALSLASRQVRLLEQPGMSPKYVEGGFLVFTQVDGTLFTAPFDARRARLTGPPQPVTEGVRLGPARIAKLGVSRSGSLAFLGGSSAHRELVIADRRGSAEVLPVPPDRYRSPRFSPDGRRLAFTIDDGSPVGGDIWTYDLGAGTLTRMTFDSASFAPEWSHDGRRILFTRREGAEFNLHWIAADGSGLSDTVIAGPLIQSLGRLTSDGKTLFFQQADEGGGAAGFAWDIWTMPVDSPSAARPLLANRFLESEPAPSPNGRWLAYVSNETGPSAIYLRGLESGGSEGRVRVSIQEGTGPRWAASGQELFYRSGDSLMVVAVAEQPGLSFGTPRAIPVGLNQTAGGYDLQPDGRRFVIARQRDTGVTTISVILNWFDQMRSGPGRRNASR